MAFDPDPALLRIDIMRTGNPPEYLKGTAILPQPNLPALLAQSKYSREFEAEANDYVFRLLKVNYQKTVVELHKTILK